MAEWPERGIWVPTWVFKAPLAPTVRDTWISLKAIAAGQDTLEITFTEIEAMTGKSRSPIMSHLALLRDRCGLRFHTAGSLLLQVTTFGDGVSILKSGLERQSQNQDLSHEGNAMPENEPNPGLSAQSQNQDSPVKSVKELKTHTGAILKSGLSQNQDLLLNTIYLGGILEGQLKKCYESKGQKPPARFKTIQQKDAYEKVARALNLEFESLIETAIARDRYSLSSLLAFLEACSRNRKSSPAVAPAKSAPGFRLPDGV